MTSGDQQPISPLRAGAALAILAAAVATPIVVGLLAADRWGWLVGVAAAIAWLVPVALLAGTALYWLDPAGSRAAELRGEVTEGLSPAGPEDLPVYFIDYEDRWHCPLGSTTHARHTWFWTAPAQGRDDVAIHGSTLCKGGKR